MIEKLTTDNQLKQIAKLEHELFHDHCYSYDQLLEMYENENYSYYVALNEDGIVLGYLILLDVIDANEIIKIGVNPKSQGMGIGSKLMQFAKELDQPLLLEVSSLNTNAISFYEYHGFKLINIRKKYYADGSDGLIYRWEQSELDHV